MQRDIEHILREWKKDLDRAPLIIRGARQVGKTHVIEAFGRDSFFTCLTIDLEKRPQLHDCFKTMEPTEIVAELELRLGQEITPGKTLLFLDEIQACPLALKSLRYFKEEMPELHVISAGSLLEFALEKEEFSFPVGRVQFLYMKPLSFREFLSVMGHGKLIDHLKTITLANPLSEGLHQELLRLVATYFRIGGMPQVIESFRQQSSYLKSLRLQEAILTAYAEDFAKYATATDHGHLQTLFDRSPDFVGKHVRYARIDPSVKKPEVVFKRALLLLTRAGLIHQVFATAGGGLPLRAQKNLKKFKLALLDLGLLQCAMGVDSASISSSSLMSINSGALAEQFVGQELLAYLDPYLNRKLYFWEREKRGSEAEVDYLFGFHGRVIPIEVKAGSTGRLRSIQQFMTEKQSTIGVRISERPLSLRNNVLSVPLYMISELSRLLVPLLNEDAI